MTSSCAKAGVSVRWRRMLVDDEMETRGDFLNLYIYSDSLAFRRIGQPQDLSFTYPFRLKALIETHLSLRTNVITRGGGGARISEIAKTLKRDTGYFGGDPSALNIAILQFGIVDCAPRPITYAVSPLLRMLPIIGPRILAKLVRHRRGLQNLWSYTVTSSRAFKKEYASIVYTCHSAQIRALAIGLPLPPLSIEYRSPGFRRSASNYNTFIRDVIPESFLDVEQDMTESLRETLLLPDGHHLTEEGHRFYAEKMFEHLKKLL